MHGFRRLSLLALTWLLCACKPAASNHTATTTPVQEHADAASGDGADVAVLPPEATPVWVTDPQRSVRNLHQTWQRDPSTTITLSWATPLVPTTPDGALDLTTYTPVALVAPATLTDAEGRGLVRQGQVVTGLGHLYQATIGSDVVPQVAWAVEVTGLQPDTAYVARVGSWHGLDASSGKLDQPDLSPLVRFRTAPAKGSTAPMTVVMAGDSRGGADQIRAQAVRLGQIPALSWFFNGDMQPLGTQLEWNEWFDAMSPILQQRPLMPVQGNHELIAENYYGQFWLPAMPGLAADYVEHAWSLDLGSVHFVGLDSNGAEAAADQSAWLAEDLAKAQADPAIKFTVAMMHHAPYSASVHGSTSYLQQHWAPLFDKYGVDLVFAGHDHDYERSKPLANNQVVGPETGVTYVVAGGFFAPPYKNGSGWWTAVSHHGNKHNYCVVEFAGNQATVTAWSGDGSEVLDTWTITR